LRSTTQGGKRHATSRPGNAGFDLYAVRACVRRDMLSGRLRARLQSRPVRDYGSKSETLQYRVLPWRFFRLVQWWAVTYGGWSIPSRPLREPGTVRIREPDPGGARCGDQSMCEGFDRKCRACWLLL